MVLYGLSGTNGSGKDTVGLMMAERHGFMFISVTDLLRQELGRRKLPVIRENTSMLSAEWRREFGPGVLMQKGIELYEKDPGEYKGLVLSSLRHPGEAEVIHQHSGKVIWVDADPRVRYDRIQANAAQRNRAGEDALSYEAFLADEAREMSPEGDEATLDMGAVKEMADVFMTNDGNDIEAFKDSAEKALHLA